MNAMLRMSPADTCAPALQGRALPPASPAVPAHSVPAPRLLQQRRPSAQRGAPPGAVLGARVCAAALAEDNKLADDDLQQYKDRDKWYVAKFCADDAPDWYPASFLSSSQVAPGLREVVLEVEISRDRVPLRNGYRHVGQRARVRLAGGAERQLAVGNPPFPLALNKEALFKVRGDMVAGEIKLVKDDLSVRAPLSLLVTAEEAEEVYNAGPGDQFECGPFQGTGMDLRGPIIGMFQYPTLVMFAEGKGIATARALVMATPDVGGLNLSLRQDVRLYYRARNEDSLVYKQEFDQWQSQHKCQVISSTRETFMEMFDNDDTLMYEPASTAAIIFAGGDEEVVKAAREVCKEAEITCIVSDSEEQPATQYLASGITDDS